MSRALEMGMAMKCSSMGLNLQKFSELESLRVWRSYRKVPCKLRKAGSCGICESSGGLLASRRKGVRIRGYGARSSIGRGLNVVQQDTDEQDISSTREILASLVRRSIRSRALSPPEVSLQEGRWVKLICGASFEDVVDIRNLSLIYTLAGVDCIDCAADAAVVAAVLDGVAAAQRLARQLDPSGTFTLERPWIMVSINDDEDPHFRKAEFDPKLCPTDCPRPCQCVCPAGAIVFNSSTTEERLLSNSMATTQNLRSLPDPQLDGVITERCYGCGRCLPVCPVGLILARTYVRELEAVASLLRNNHIDAIEIHTGAGHLEAFDNLVRGLSAALQTLQLIAVSVPDLGKSMVPALASMYKILQPSLKGYNLWQLDGRPMSGDIGVGATRAAVALASHVAESQDRPPGYLQLAGGTNAHTVDVLEREGLFLSASTEGEAVIAGVAYGGYARKIVTKYLQCMGSCKEKWNVTSFTAALPSGASLVGIEHYPSLLLGALQEAAALVGHVKGL